jgi:hypothetical protein
MNWLLAKLVRLFNAVIALIILVSGFSFAFLSLENYPSINTEIGAIPTFLLIIFGTFVLLTIFCGLIALLSQIETHLEEIKNNTAPRPNMLKD